MPETLQKLQPDRDLQCYFFQPSAIAALSSTSPTGFTVSGSWRQQFDWAVIEWNRDNVFEHPAFRSLPDGDLSGLTLSYEETRENCIPLDSDLYPTVDWPSLRAWADDGTGEKVYKIPLTSHASPIAGRYQCATVQFTLSGTVTAGDYVGIAFLSEHYPYLMSSDSDTLDHADSICRLRDQWFLADNVRIRHWHHNYHYLLRSGPSAARRQHDRGQWKQNRCVRVRLGQPNRTMGCHFETVLWWNFSIRSGKSTLRSHR